MSMTRKRESDVFAAISHPARRRMLDLLLEADRSVNTMAGHFQMSRPAVSQHLRILLDAGLVTEQRHGRERRYHFVPEKLGPIREWMGHYERFWDQRPGFAAGCFIQKERRMTQTIRREMFDCTIAGEGVGGGITDRSSLAKWLFPNDFVPRLGHRFTFEVPGKSKNEFHRAHRSLRRA